LTINPYPTEKLCSPLQRTIPRGCATWRFGSWQTGSSVRYGWGAMSYVSLRRFEQTYRLFFKVHKLADVKFCLHQMFDLQNFTSANSFCCRSCCTVSFVLLKMVFWGLKHGG